MNWFKMFTEARNDAKLRSLTDAQHRTWFRLLCYAAEQDSRGKIGPTPLTVVALEVANGDASLLEETCNALQALQCVTWSKCNAATVEIEFNSFAKRQMRKPSDDPERIRERVNKCRSKSSPRKQVASNEQHDDAACNAPVTRYRRDVTRVTPIEEIRQEKRNTPLPPTGDEGGGDVEPFEPGGPDPGTVVAPPVGWTAQHQSVLDRQSQRFAASNGDRVIADLLRDFSPRIVARACDEHFARDDGALDCRKLMGICRAMHEGRWKMHGTGKPAAAPRPDNRRIFVAPQPRDPAMTVKLPPRTA